MLLLFYGLSPFRFHYAVESVTLISHFCQLSVGTTEVVLHHIAPLLQLEWSFHQFRMQQYFKSTPCFQYKWHAKWFVHSVLTEHSSPVRQNSQLYHPEHVMWVCELWLTIARPSINCLNHIDMLCLTFSFAPDKTNDLPNASAGEVHIVCLPYSSSGSSTSSESQNEFLTSEQLDGVYFPFNGAV